MNIKMPKGLTEAAEDIWLDLARGIADATSTTQIDAILAELNGFTPADGLPAEEIQRLTQYAKVTLNDLRLTR